MTRRVILDGDAVPFEEAARVEFPYGNGWRSMALGADGQTFSFYLSEGTHTLTFEAGLGRMADLLERANTCLSSLNAIYRNILTLTGSSPDTNRDYEFEIYITRIVYGDFLVRRTHWLNSRLFFWSTTAMPSIFLAATLLLNRK